MNTSLTTTEAVAYLRQLGLPANEATLRADAHRGLVSPTMPALDPLGRGTRARWTAASLRRLEYLGRLRRRGVNGRVLPLLAFVYDGWGWEHVLPAVQGSG